VDLRPANGGGTRATFETLYKAHFQAIYAYALRRVPADDAVDLVADVFTVAWRRIEDLPLPPEDKLWLYGVARRTVSQHGRGRLRRDRLVAKLRQNIRFSDSPTSDEDSFLESRIVELVSHLQPNDRELVRLIAWDHLSHSEAAEVMGCSVNAVSIRWHRSLRRLRRDIGTRANLLTPGRDDDLQHPKMPEMGAL
jgi:RNA polymerase sigma-70 factor (ECF subfamily)